MLNGRHEAVGEDDAILQFAIFTLRDLKAKEELVLDWEWDDSAVVYEISR